MPRHSRVIFPGYTYHLTHRCHDRQFLLRFQRDRNTNREWLREGAQRHGVPVLGYCVTSNHIHVVIHAEAQQPVSTMMRLAAGCTAGEYNQGKGRRGGFWDGRFRCTAVESGEHLWNCLGYVDMNMVRAGVVAAGGVSGVECRVSHGSGGRGIGRQRNEGSGRCDAARGKRQAIGRTGTDSSELRVARGRRTARGHRSDGLH